MLFTIESGSAQAVITDLGAELMSLKTNGTEYLWQGNPEYWAGRAYNLFPVIGRLKGGKYLHNGQEYEMGIHGFARKTVFSADQTAPDSVTFSITDSPETLTIYPFTFSFSVTYTLTANTLSVAFRVRNTGHDNMYFSVGGHPGFNVPLDSSERFENYALEFDTTANPRLVRFTDELLISGTDSPFPLKDGKTLPLAHSLFDNDAMVFSQCARGITLKSTFSGHGVRVAYPDMPYVGIWHKPKSSAPYVCIEPWTGLPGASKLEELKDKQNITCLAKGGVYHNTWTIELL